MLKKNSLLLLFTCLSFSLWAQNAVQFYVEASGGYSYLTSYDESDLINYQAGIGLSYNITDRLSAIGGIHLYSKGGETGSPVDEPFVFELDLRYKQLGPQLGIEYTPLSFLKISGGVYASTTLSRSVQYKLRTKNNSERHMHRLEGPFDVEEEFANTEAGIHLGISIALGDNWHLKVQLLEGLTDIYNNKDAEFPILFLDIEDEEWMNALGLGLTDEQIVDLNDRLTTARSRMLTLGFVKFI